MNKFGKEKLASLLKKKSVLFVDMRSPVEFRDSHVSGAVNLPLKNFTNKLMSIPKTTTIVAYSNNFTDVDLTRGMNYAEQLGFTDLHMGEYNSIKE